MRLFLSCASYPAVFVPPREAYNHFEILPRQPDPDPNPDLDSSRNISFMVEVFATIASYQRNACP